MAKGKVESVSFVESWKDGSRHNFTVKFDTMAKDERVIFSWKEKETPMLKVGDETEYSLTGRSVSFYLNGKKYEYPQAELPKNKPSFGGGGGGKGYVKTKEQELNQLLGVCGSYTKDLICHRTTLGQGKDGKELAKLHVEMTLEIYNGLKDLIQ